MKWVKLVAVVAASTIGVVCGFYLFAPHALYRASRCLQGAEHWYSCYQNQEFEFTTDFYGMTYSGNTRNTIDRDILFVGAFEKPILYFLRDVVSAEPGTALFLDIGANTGQHSLFMSRYVKQIHAFEPYEPVLERFRAAIATNAIKNVVIHPVGLGDVDAMMPFFRPPDENLGTGSFVAGFTGRNTPHKDLHIVIGDQVLADAGVGRVDLIKMDIEGYERLALRGLERTLRADRPIVEFEMTIDPKGAASFRSMESLRLAFPENYEFLVFSKKSDPYRGTYYLDVFDGSDSFGVLAQHDMVAYPVERQARVPRHGEPQ